jgi:hypothetical protein
MEISASCIREQQSTKEGTFEDLGLQLEFVAEPVDELGGQIPIIDRAPDGLQIICNRLQLLAYVEMDMSPLGVLRSALLRKRYSEVWSARKKRCSLVHVEQAVPSP